MYRTVNNYHLSAERKYDIHVGKIMTRQGLAITEDTLNSSQSDSTLRDNREQVSIECRSSSFKMSDLLHISCRHCDFLSWGL